MYISSHRDKSSPGHSCPQGCERREILALGCHKKNICLGLSMIAHFLIRGLRMK